MACCICWLFGIHVIDEFFYFLLVEPPIYSSTTIQQPPSLTQSASGSTTYTESKSKDRVCQVPGCVVTVEPKSTATLLVSVGSAYVLYVIMCIYTHVSISTAINR